MGRRASVRYLLLRDRMRGILLAVFSGTLLAGCTQGIEGGVNGSAPTEGEPDAAASPTVTDFDRAMMELGRDYKTFTRIDKRAYTSSLGAFQINVYVDGDGGQYRKIHPEVMGTGTKIPVGTVIVREVLDEAGKISKLTLMAKGPSGYDARIGDWWWGEADPAGNPTKLGRLTECHGCHIPRAGDDYLFGVPREDQR